MPTPQPSVSGRPWAAFFSAVALAILAACAPAAAPAPSTTPAPSSTPAPATRTPEPQAPTLAPTPEPASPTAPPTPTETATPTAQPIGQPTLGYFNITPRADATLVTPFPTPMAALPAAPGVVNVLLIGTDSRPYLETGFRTDTLIIVSINRESRLVTLVSIPRDLFIYVPTWGMTRINTAYDIGERLDFPGGGPGLLAQTVLYNLGVPIHFHALINFAGFRQIVDQLGGIQVAVPCPLTEYRLNAPDLDETKPENYSQYTQPIGVAQMDGDLALWYARARPVGGDFFRSYRQRQVLRAMYRGALSAGVIPRIPALYQNLRDVVATDMGLWDVMQFAPLALDLGETRIRSFAIGPNQTSRWLTPRGEDVLLPRPGPLAGLLQTAFQPPSANEPQRPVTQVEIVNASGQPDWDQLAAEVLRNDGYAPVIAPPAEDPEPTTRLVDLTTGSKGSPAAALQTLFHLPDRLVAAEPDAASPSQFRVILGRDYVACPRLDWIATPTPAP